MMESDTQSRSQTGTGSEQHFIVDGCKVTVRYSEESDPRCAKEIKSLLLAAQFPDKK